jgi:tripartite-type tricarboxylate transporter receptor subunit TctC
MANDNTLSFIQPDAALSRRSLLGAGSAAAAAWALAPASALAQSKWPAKPVTLVVPFPAGGGTDAFARPMSAQFSKLTGTQLVIDNRGGAGGTLGAGIAAKAQPDGYTLFMGAVHHAIAPSMYPKLDYDIEKDFIPLALVANVPQVLVVNPKNVPGDYKAFLAQVKASPGKMNYGSAGGGTSHHLAGELFKQQTGTFITHIPYRGAGPALQDLMAGSVDMMFDGLGSSANHIKGGRIKALMVSGTKRSPAFPDVPCAAELGLPNYTVTTWYGLWAPKGTPADVQARVVEEVNRLAAADEIKTAWANNGAEFGKLTPAQFGTFVSAEIKRWAAVVKASGAKLD